MQRKLTEKKVYGITGRANNSNPAPIGIASPIPATSRSLRSRRLRRTSTMRSPICCPVPMSPASM